MHCRLHIFLCWLAIAGFVHLSASAQHPVYKVDFDMTGRPSAAVTEPGFIAWALPTNVADTATLVLNPSTGLTLRMIRKGPYGDKLNTNWYKAGTETPYFARLGSDGIRVNNANNGAQIEMRISGLPTGRHSILTYHNNVDNPSTNTFSPVDVYLNGVKEIEDLAPSVRALTIPEIPTAYLYVDAVAGEDVVLLYVADTAFTANNKNLLINGFELNTSNPLYKAQGPFPSNGDEHADADNGSLQLRWLKAQNAVAAHVYVGGDSTAVSNAVSGGPLYKGRVVDTFFNSTNQYSMYKYFWRVDMEDEDGNTTKGDVWYYQPRQLAFRDAEGYGRFARGGRGGKVVYVTNLNDSGPGSLREAVTNDIGPRTIMFDVSGIITLNSRLVISSNYVTVAGQTAPGKGICIKGAPFGAGGRDIIIRHLRVRVGGGQTYDGMGMVGDHCIMDNCSISWTIDESFSSRGARNISFQRNMISEALNVAGHQNYPAGTAHGYAATISGNKGSFHHNLLAHNSGRNWSLGGALDGNAYYSGHLDIRNNVVYNWGTRTTDGGAHQVNFVNNYYKPGAASTIFFALTAQHEGVGLGTQQYHFIGNVMPGRFDESNQDAGRRIQLSNGAVVNWQTWIDTAFFPSYVNTQSATDAYKRVLSNVGANQPVFDDHDVRIVNETLNGTYTYSGSVSGKPGLIDNQNDAGGWEDYGSAQRPAAWDTDRDGLPDWWERLTGSSTTSAAGDFSDANADADRNGTTQLDAYLEWMGGPHYFTRPTDPIQINLSNLSRGYTSSPSFTVANVTNGSVVLSVVGGATIATFTPAAAGFGSFEFTVTDAQGATMTTLVNLVADDNPITLPVRLTKFTAARKDKQQVNLEWETEQEINNSHFEIERSFTGNGFVKIAQVASAAPDGNSHSRLSYQLTDNNDHAGKSYYRLAQVDIDGKVKYSDIRLVNGVGDKASLRLWPVPSKGNVNLLLDGGTAGHVSIITIDGKTLVLEFNLLPGVARTVHISKPGTYLVKVVDRVSGEVRFTEKVVVW
jgi:hypothetical protein